MEGLDSSVEVFDDSFDVEFVARHAKDKMVGFCAATDGSARVECHLKIICRCPQNQIAGVDMKKIVDDFEAADVHANDAIFHVEARAQKQRRLPIKSFAVIKSGQRIKLAADCR